MITNLYRAYSQSGLDFKGDLVGMYHTGKIYKAYSQSGLDFKGDLVGMCDVGKIYKAYSQSGLDFKGDLVGMYDTGKIYKAYSQSGLDFKGDLIGMYDSSKPEAACTAFLLFTIYKPTSCILFAGIDPIPILFLSPVGQVLTLMEPLTAF